MITRESLIWLDLQVQAALLTFTIEVLLSFLFSFCAPCKKRKINDVPLLVIRFSILYMAQCYTTKLSVLYEFPSVLSFIRFITETLIYQLNFLLII